MEWRKKTTTGRQRETFGSRTLLCLDVGVLVKDHSYRLAPPVLNVGYLEELRDNRAHKSGAEQQDKPEPSPRKTVNGVVDLNNAFHNFLL